MMTFDDVLDRGRRQRDAEPGLLDTMGDALAPDDLATLVYTSGTTGLPKGVMLTHDNLVSNVLGVEDRFPFDPEAERGGVMLSYLPLSHSLERTATLAYLYIGYPIYFVDDLHEIRDDLQTVQPIHMTTVPRLLEKIHAGIQARAAALSGVQGVLLRWALGVAARYDVETPPSGFYRLQHDLADRLVFKKLRAAVFGGRFRAVTSGGAALPPTLMTFFNALGVFCGQGYGLTETAPVATLYQQGALRLGSAGLAIRDVEIRIADDGEILVRGPNIMKGYYKLPDKTAEVLTEDGWFHTGDIGHLDEGHLFITDRKKELFKLSTGKYIAPTPIEIALSASPLIEQAVVVGSEYKFCAALIVLDAQAVRQRFPEDALPKVGFAEHADVIDLIDDAVAAVNRALPHWEQVKKFCLLEHPFSIDGGELTPTMKVKRRVVHEKYRRQIESMYE
jgi:long-chain acyl-CoA synthetase